jgi:hypothetical protein
MKNVALLPHMARLSTFTSARRVYKRVSRALIFTCCPNAGQFLEPKCSRFVIHLPQSSSNALSVKLVILFMEQYLINPGVRIAPWIINDDFISYIDLAQLFEFIGMSEAAGQLEIAIIRSMRERPLDAEEVSKIWARENAHIPSRYAKAMAENIFTFTCVAEVEMFLTQYDIEPAKTYEQRFKQVRQRRADMVGEPTG